MLPPGPRSPRLVQTFAFGLRPLRFLEDAWREHGDLFTIHLSHEGKWVVVADPAVANEVFRLPPDVARAGEANAFLRPVLGAASVVVADGDDHLAKRRFAERRAEPPPLGRGAGGPPAG